MPSLPTAVIKKSHHRAGSLRIPIAIKLALAFALLIATSMSLLGLVILQQQKDLLSQQISNAGNTLAMQMANNVSELIMADDVLGLQTLVNSASDHNLLGVVVIAENGKVLASNGVTPQRDRVEANRALLTNNTVHTFDWRLSGEGIVFSSFISQVRFNELTAGYVVLTFSRNVMQQSLRESRWMIAQITLLATVVAVMFAYLLSRHLSRPMQHLVVASAEIDRGNYHYRLQETRNDEIGDLAQAFNQMAEGLLTKNQVEKAFSRYVSPNVARKILEQPDHIELGGRYVQATVVFADVVGFTSMAENMQPQSVIELLNEYFSYIANIASVYGGHVDKYIGDCAMLVFGSLEEDSDHILNALISAVMIRKLVIKLNEKRVRNGMLPVHFRIGVNAGSMVAGNLGSPERMDFTVIGDSVNMASRLSAVADLDQIVILDELYQRPDIQSRIIARPGQTIQVRGKQKPVTTWLVEDIQGEANTMMKQRMEDLLQQRGMAS